MELTITRFNLNVTVLLRTYKYQTFLNHVDVTHEYTHPKSAPQQTLMETKTSGVHSVPVGEEIRLNAKSHPIIDRGSMLVRIEFAPQEEICEKSVENVIGVD